MDYLNSMNPVFLCCKDNNNKHKKGKNPSCVFENYFFVLL